MRFLSTILCVCFIAVLVASRRFLQPHFGIQGWLFLVGLVIVWFALDIILYLQKKSLKKQLQDFSADEMGISESDARELDKYRETPRLGADLLASAGQLIELPLSLAFAFGFCYLVLILRRKPFSWSSGMDFFDVLTFFLACGIYLGVRHSLVRLMQPKRETWEFDSLEKIGGHPVEVIGSPKLVTGDRGKAMAFDGKADQIIVKANPIGDSKVFTFEVVFKPAADLNRTNDPRFIHVQDPDDPEARRLMLEIRVNDKDQWVFDAFILTGLGEIPLLDHALVHRTKEWSHVAVTYDGKTFSSFVDGRPELSGPMACKDLLFGPNTVVSVGARMNRKFHLQGEIKTIRVTRAVLDPMDFLL